MSEHMAKIKADFERDLRESTIESIKPSGVEVRNKYMREIKNGVFVDVYEVLKAFDVTDQAVGHAIKKLLAGGKRGYKSEKQDLQEAIDSIKRAIEIMDDHY